MMLSNRTLLARMDRSANEPWARLEVAPFLHEMLQPHSIDVHLGRLLKVYAGPHTDTQRDNSPWWETLCPEEGQPLRWALQPDRFYLGALLQFVRVPEDCCGRLEGVSSRARDGITVHQTAGLLDAGWRGWATLEISVKNPHTIVYAGDRIGQVTFTLLDRPADPPYRGRYLDDAGPQPAKFLDGKPR